MHDHDERAELAPRDIVARAIDYEMKKEGLRFLSCLQELVIGTCQEQV